MHLWRWSWTYFAHECSRVTPLSVTVHKFLKYIKEPLRKKISPSRSRGEMWNVSFYTTYRARVSLHKWWIYAAVSEADSRPASNPPSLTLPLSIHAYASHGHMEGVTGYLIFCSEPKHKVSKQLRQNIKLYMRKGRGDTQRKGGEEERRRRDELKWRSTRC